MCVNNIINHTLEYSVLYLLESKVDIHSCCYS